jgi:membrane protease subunit (stomatin/prohibitin family)
MLGAAEGLFGGIFGQARSAMGEMRSAGWSKARDVALRGAVEQAAAHFHRCPRCSNHFCDNCWNADDGTCISCVPRLDAEIAVINREARIQKARERAEQTATVSDADMREKVVSCPSCGAAVGKAKFCPECGTAVSLNRTCASCQAEIPRASKFCPECGAKA